MKTYIREEMIEHLEASYLESFDHKDIRDIIREGWIGLDGLENSELIDKYVSVLSPFREVPEFIFEHNGRKYRIRSNESIKDLVDWENSDFVDED